MLNRLQIISVFSLIFVIFLMGCNSTPSRSISLREMLIDESELPDGWEIIKLGPDPIVHFGQDNAIEMIFYYMADPRRLIRGGITIYQFDRENKAIQSYERLEKTFFNQDDVSVITPFFVPEGFSFTSSIANQWRFSCHGDSFQGLIEKSTICQSLTRYEEFVVFSNINTEYQREAVISTEEMQSLFEAIDQQIVTILEEQPSN